MSTPDENDVLIHARGVMEPFLSALAAKPGVQAVYILSSSARNAAQPTLFDQESDFDVSLVLDVPMAVSEWRPQRCDSYRLLANRIPKWVPNFLFCVPVPWGRMEVNVHQLIFQYEADPRTVWDGEQCDTYLNKREVIHDQDGLFAILIERKVMAARTQLAIEHARLANRITWDVREMPLRQARRLGPPTGHYILNVAIEEVVDCIYMLHGQFVPNKKWKLAHLVKCSLISLAQATLLNDALRCDPTSMADLVRRIDALETLCHSVEGLLGGGSVALENRRRFQSRIQFLDQTFADSVSKTVNGSVADTVRDIANYSLSESSVDLVNTLAN